MMTVTEGGANGGKWETLNFFNLRCIFDRNALETKGKTTNFLNISH